MDEAAKFAHAEEQGIKKVLKRVLKKAKSRTYTIGMWYV